MHQTESQISWFMNFDTITLKLSLCVSFNQIQNATTHRKFQLILSLPVAFSTTASFQINLKLLWVDKKRYLFLVFEICRGSTSSDRASKRVKKDLFNDLTSFRMMWIKRPTKFVTILKYCNASMAILKHISKHVHSKWAESLDAYLNNLKIYTFIVYQCEYDSQTYAQKLNYVQIIE